MSDRDAEIKRPVSLAGDSSPPSSPASPEGLQLRNVAAAQQLCKESQAFVLLLSLAGQVSPFCQGQDLFSLGCFESRKAVSEQVLG